MNLTAQNPCSGRSAAVLLGVLFLGAFSAGAADWPQWRHDANRSGATEEAVPDEPSLLWHRVLGRPDPAYDHQYRMCADETYAAIAAEGLVFIPSNVTDQVLARDLRTGAVRWRFVTGGPVRFAPVYCDGTLCFGSDDGWLYGLSARDGRLRWKVRGAPERLPDSRMLINGRLCSRWPVRGAPVASEGVVYFGAGVWPEEGVYVCAVEADTGKLLWRSDAMSYVKDGMSDHGRAYDIGLPPQGYLAVIDGALAVPSGRSLAAWFDPATGEMEPYTCFYVKNDPPRGTWYLAGINQYSVQGGNWFGTRSDALPPLPPELKDAKSPLFWSRQQRANERFVIENRPFFNTDSLRLHDENLYTEPVLTPTTSYASEFDDERDYLVPRGHTHVKYREYDRIVARDLTRPHWTTTVGRNYLHGRGKVSLRRMEFPIRWELECPLKVLIKAGDRLYAGGKDTIAAIAIPQEGQEPHIAWKAKVQGVPVNALVADGTLVVVTNSGHAYAFGRGTGNPVQPSETATQQKPAPAQYALVLGWGGGTQAEALAEEGQHRVVVIEPNPKTVNAARRRLAEKNRYGRRVQVLEGDLATTKLAPYWASLVTLESETALGAKPAKGLPAALDLLRPYGGELRLPASTERTAALKKLLAGRPGYAMHQAGGRIKVRRDGAPEGSDDWTHEAGGPDNRFASSDRLVKWPLALLWYSGDIDRYFTPALHFQHQRQPYPLVAGGRMFLITGQLLHAVDIYTGSYLWKAEMPMTPWVRTRFFDSRIYGRPTERNCVAAPDLVYAVTGRHLRAYDAATGEEQRVFDAPASLRQEAKAAAAKPVEKRYHGHRGTIQAEPLWTEVRLWKDTLFAVLAGRLVALDCHSGQVRWTRRSTRETTTYAIGDDTLFGLDCDRPALGGDPETGTRSGLLFALDPETGRPLWNKPLDYAAVPEHQVKSPRLWLRPVIPLLAHNARHGLLVLAVNRNSVRVFRAQDGSPLWSKTSTAPRNLQRLYAPVVTDDHLLLSRYKGCFGYLLDIRTGKDAGPTTGIPTPRTCARVIGNNHLLVYRDAATELYDIERSRMIGLNSVRAGCTTSFIPAGGVMAAPMLGHGCVCNYPMFASLALYHSPDIEAARPAAVQESWTNQAKPILQARAEDPFIAADGKVDTDGLHPINATIEAAGAALRFQTKDRNVGYAVRAADKPIRKATFQFAVKRAPGTRRHGNAFFVCGPSADPKDFIQCRLYYGGRSSLMIAGGAVKTVEKKIPTPRRLFYTITVTLDCQRRTVVLQAAGATLKSQITAPLDTFTHYGYGGSNAASLFTDIAIR